MLAEREQIKLEESNMALFGSELERKVKEAAAQGEPAWHGCGQTAGETKVWRVEKFNIVAWPEDRYGSFYDGDSYIVLRTTQSKDNADKLEWDIYFWLGQYTTQDESGTAAYKTVELDDFFGGAPVQHRELQGSESSAFLALFNGSLTIMNGGIESGFKHVEIASTQKHDPRLFHVAGPTMRTVRVTQLPELKAGSLSEGDCFILDNGDRTFFVFQGATASPGEKNKASMYAQTLSDSINGSRVEVCNFGDAPAAFWDLLGGKPDALPAEVSKNAVSLLPSDGAAAAAAAGPTLFQVTSGDGAVNTVAEGNEAVKAAGIDSDSCYVLVTADPSAAVCWVGAGAVGLGRAAMSSAHSCLQKAGLPVTTPITKVVQGRESKQWTQFCAVQA